MCVCVFVLVWLWIIATVKNDQINELLLAAGLRNLFSPCHCVSHMIGCPVHSGILVVAWQRTHSELQPRSRSHALIDYCFLTTAIPITFTSWLKWSERKKNTRVKKLFVADIYLVWSFLNVQKLFLFHLYLWMGLFDRIHDHLKLWELSINGISQWAELLTWPSKIY